MTTRNVKPAAQKQPPAQRPPSISTTPQPARSAKPAQGVPHDPNDFVCRLQGNLGSDPEMSYTPSGSAVTHFSLATYAGKEKETKANMVTWVKIELWKEAAELANASFKKGDKVLIEGFSPVIDTWLDTEENTRFKLVMTGFKASLISRPEAKG